jgi:hypothetical protein
MGVHTPLFAVSGSGRGGAYFAQRQLSLLLL